MSPLLRYGILFAALVFAGSISAQQGYQFISSDYNRDLQQHINSPASNLHGQIQPFLNADLVEELNPDSLHFDSTAWKLFGQSLPATRTPLKGQWRWRAFPFLNALSGIDLNETNYRGTFETGVGAAVGADVGRRLSFYADFFVNYGRYPSYIQQYMDSLNAATGKGYARWDGNAFSNYDYNFYLSYGPSKPFNIQAGIGKNFWGDGMRSLFLSDQATSYPFLKITTTIWNIKYVNLFNVMYDIRGASGNYNDFALKYSTMHYLSYNVSRRVNVSLWESVIWQNRDNGNFRGFDVNYLNPIIFYRPVEFAQGSSDRVTIGASLSVKVGGNTKIYGQLALDEFLLDSLLAGNGWFGNKHAGQLGFKSFNCFRIEGFDLQAEFNVVRPFVYQHVSVKQNHAHFNEPLAHTLGNNFYEGIVAGSYRKGPWVLDGRLVIAQYGRDTDSLNLGGNIFRSDVDQPRPESGHDIGQGIEHFLVAGEIRLGYLIDRRLGLRVELGYTPRYLRIEGDWHSNHFIQFGVRTTLWNRNRFF